MNSNLTRMMSSTNKAPMRASFKVVAVVFVALFVGWPVTVPAGEAVPFKGSLEGDVTFAPPDPFVFIEGTGSATQLGRFTVEVPHDVDFATSTGSGFYEFTAANGDTLTAAFTGQASPTETPGVLSIVETATITGGTGRFAGASGSFTAERLFNVVTGLTTGSFEGTISSPGAEHASLSVARFQTH